MRLRNLLPVIVAVSMMVPIVAAQGNVIDYRTAAREGGQRLLDVQRDDGSLPWRIGDPGTFQNVQGVTAQGFLAAYKVTGDRTYLDDGHNGGAAGTHTWLQNFYEENPDAFSSAPNSYFLAEYAVATGQEHDMELARERLQQDLALFDDGNASNGTAAQDLARAILEFRKATGHTNLGLWDVALFVRAAHDVGNTTMSEQFADVLADQEIVDPFDANASSYEIGLAGLLFGLAEDDVVGHRATVQQAHEALLDAQGPNGSFPNDVGEGDVQTTAYAAIGLAFVGDLDDAQQACDFIAEEQATGIGGWPVDGTEFAETDSEAVQALAACIAPTRNGATSYADAARRLI